MHAVFGGRAIELAGRAVHPEVHGNGIGTAMLEDFMQQEAPNLLTTYTRNPAIIRMVGKVAHTLYPLDQSQTLQSTATEMPGATLRDNTVYHFNRYGPNGLYQREDPADQGVNTSLPLKEQYPGLKDTSTALVIAAHTKKGIK